MEKYQPSTEETEKAETSMLPEQTAASAERMSMVEKIDDIILKEREKVMGFVTKIRNGKLIEDNFQEIINSCILNNRFAAFNFEQQAEDFIKWKELVSPEASQYIAEMLKNETEDYKIDLRFFGKTFKSPRNEDGHIFHEFEDCWVSYDDQYFVNTDENGEPYNSRTISVIRKMPPEEAESELIGYVGEESVKRRRNQLLFDFINDANDIFLKSQKNTLYLNKKLNAIFHSDESINVDDLNSLYYVIFKEFQEPNSRLNSFIDFANEKKFIIKEKTIEEVFPGKEGDEDGHGYKVYEIDINKLDEDTSMELLLDNFITRTNPALTIDQIDILKGNLIKAAQNLEPGVHHYTGNYSSIDREKIDLTGMAYAGYGKDENGQPWFDVAHVNHKYNGPLKGLV